MIEAEIFTLEDHFFVFFPASSLVHATCYTQISSPVTPSRACDLLNFALKVLPLHKFRYVVLPVLLPFFPLFSPLLLLKRLVALGKLSERSQRVGAELVENTGNELGELFVFARAVDGEGIRWNGRMDCVGGGCQRVANLGAESAIRGSRR